MITEGGNGEADSIPYEAGVSIACDTLPAAWRMTSRKHCNDACWQLLALRNGIGSAFLVVEEHVDVPPSCTPFDLIEEELRLETTSDLECSPAIAGGNSMRNEQLPLNLRLYS